MMDFVSLQYFVEVAKELNVTKAAAKLHVSQQTVSVHIQKLESYYGVKLFYRKPTFTLTEDGRELLQMAAEMLVENNNMLRCFQAKNKLDYGYLNIGCSSHSLNTRMPMILDSFYSVWPNVKITLFNESHRDMAKMLLEGSIDILITTSMENIADSRVYSKPAISDHLNLIVPSDLLKKIYPDSYDSIAESERAGTDLKAFRALPYMLLRPGVKKRVLVDQAFHDAGYAPKIIFEAGRTAEIIRYAPLHIGGFFCDGLQHFPFSREALSDYYAFPLLIKGEVVQKTIIIAHSKQRKLPPYGIDFFRYLKEALNSQT